MLKWSWLEILKKKNHLKTYISGGIVIFKCTLKKEDGKARTESIWLRSGHASDCSNTVMNPRVP
jgi:hypothetical protein